MFPVQSTRLATSVNLLRHSQRLQSIAIVQRARRPTTKMKMNLLIVHVLHGRRAHKESLAARHRPLQTVHVPLVPPIGTKTKLVLLAQHVNPMRSVPLGNMLVLKVLFLSIVYVTIATLVSFNRAPHSHRLLVKHGKHVMQGSLAVRQVVCWIARAVIVVLANFKQMIIQMQRSVPLGEHVELARESEQLAV